VRARLETKGEGACEGSKGWSGSEVPRFGEVSKEAHERLTTRPGYWRGGTVYEGRTTLRARKACDEAVPAKRSPGSNEPKGRRREVRHLRVLSKELDDSRGGAF
jgi:hypothetical protein